MCLLFYFFIDLHYLHNHNVDLVEIYVVVDILVDVMVDNLDDVQDVVDLVVMLYMLYNHAML